MGLRFYGVYLVGVPNFKDAFVINALVVSFMILLGHSRDFEITSAKENANILHGAAKPGCGWHACSKDHFVMNTFVVIMIL